VAAALGVAAGGCLVDYPDLPDPLRFARNRPPRIEESNVQPQRFVTLDPSQPGGCVETLSFSVADPDVDQELRVVWLVDFDPSAGERPPFREPTPILPNSVRGEVRTFSPSFPLNPAATASPVATPGVHLVEAYLSDGEITTRVNEEDQTVSIISQDVSLKDPATESTYTDRSFIVSYAWFVTTQPGCNTAGAGE
jgi:hypothetical protein